MKFTTAGTIVDVNIKKKREMRDIGRVCRDEQFARGVSRVEDENTAKISPRGLILWLTRDVHTRGGAVFNAKSVGTRCTRAAALR